MSEPACDGPRLGCTVTVHQHTEIQITEVERCNLKTNGRQIPQSYSFHSSSLQLCYCDSCALDGLDTNGQRKQNQMTNISQ